MIGKYPFLDFWNVPSRQKDMNAIHEGRIVSHFLGHRPEKMPDTLLVLDIHIKIAHKNHTSSARILSLPRLNSPDSIYCFIMLTPSFWSNEIPEISSKQITSNWHTRLLCPVAMLTNILATVALSPEIKWA
jgi:hypothetical protein